MLTSSAAKRTVDSKNMLLDSNGVQVTAIVASFVAGFVLKSYGRHVLTVARQITSPQDTKLVLVVRTDLRMGAGKVASQCSHAAVACYKQAVSVNPKMVAAWEAQGQPKIVLRAQQSGEQGLTGLAGRAAQHGLTTVVVRDAGRTEVARGSATVLGVGPGDAKTISEITATYRLL